MSLLPLQQWPPPAPGLATVWEFADRRDLRWFWRQYGLWIVVCAFLGMLAAGVWSYFNPPRYQSEAKVRFLPPQVANRFVDPNFSMEVTQRLFALSQLLNSRLTATKLIEGLSLYPELRRFQTVADLTPRFATDLQVVQISDDGDSKKTVPTLALRFSYPDADKAQRVVQKLIEQIYEENRKYRGDESLGTTEFLAEQLTAAEEAVLDAEQRLGEVQDLMQSNVSQTRLGQATSRSYIVDSRLRDLRHDRRLLEERRGSKKAELEQLELLQKRIETRPWEFYIPELEGMTSYWKIKEQLSLARSHEASVRERWKTGYPPLVAAEQATAEWEAAVDHFQKERGARLKGRDLDANAAKIALARLELRSLELESAEQGKEENELRAEAQRLREQQASPAGQEVEFLVAKREYENAKEHFSGLLKKHEESRAASEMERRGQGETVELLEPASHPERAQLPNWWMRLVMGFLLGAATSALGLLAKTWQRPLVLHEGHLEKWAGLPVLASFSLEGLEGKKRWLSGRAAALALCLVLLSNSCTQLGTGAAALTKKGEAAERDGKLAGAMMFYQQALRQDARYAPAHAAMGRLALRMGELGAAREALARAVELDPQQRGMLRQLAETSYQLYFADPGRPTTLLREVEELGERLRQQWPQQPDGHRILAQVLMERHRLEEAVKLLEGAVDRVQESETLRAQLAALLFRLGRAEESEEILQRLTEESPSYAQAYDVLYLQLMQRQEAGRARDVLVRKSQRTQELDAVLQLAAHEDARGERDSAREILQSRQADVVAGVLGWARMGDFWLQRQEWADSRQAYEQGLKREPARRAEYVGRLAEWHLAQNQKQEAQELVAAEAARQPGNPLMGAYQAALRIGELPPERRAEERKQLEAILQQMPDSPFVRYHLGRAYLLERNWQGAADQWERAVKLDATYAAGWVALAELELLRGNPAQAEARADMALRVQQRNLPAMILRARAQARRGKNGEARKSLEQILSVAPENREAQFWLASSYAAAGRNTEAAQLIEAGAKAAPGDVRWLLADVSLLTRQGKTTEARGKLQAALAAASSKEQILERLGDLDLARQDGAAASGWFEKLVALAPDNLDYQLGLAGARVLSGDREAAVAAYQRLQKSHGADVRVWLQAGALLAEMGRTPEARASYEQALQRDGRNPFVLNNLAWLLLQSGQGVEKALEYAQEAKRQLRQAPEVDGTLGAIYTKLAMHRNAVAVYEEMMAYVGAGEQPRVEKLLAEARRNSQAAAKTGTKVSGL
jgi:cellulose synthase operon protein C